MALLLIRCVDWAGPVRDAARKAVVSKLDDAALQAYQAVVDKSPTLARRIIFTTDDGASPEMQRFVRETGNEMILKPFKIEEIERAVANAMNN